jgi:hypothetical protein
MNIYNTEINILFCSRVSTYRSITDDMGVFLENIMIIKTFDWQNQGLIQNWKFRKYSCCYHSSKPKLDVLPINTKMCKNMFYNKYSKIYGQKKDTIGNTEARKLVLDTIIGLSTGNVVQKPQITDRCTKMIY